MRLLLFQSKRNGGGGGDGGDSVGGTADIEAAAALSASAVAAAEPSNDPPSVAAAAHNTSRQAEKRATHCSPSVATPAAGGVDDGTMNEKKEENCRRVEGTVDTVALNGSVHDNDGSALGMDSSLQTEHAHPAVDDDEDLDAILETMDIDTHFNVWSSISPPAVDPGNTTRSTAATAAAGLRASEEDIPTTTEEVEVVRSDCGTDDIRPVENVVVTAATTRTTPMGENNNINNTSIDSDDDGETKPGMDMWKERYERDEVYSSNYRPTSAELKDLDDIETLLWGGTNNNKRLNRFWPRKPPSSRNTNNNNNTSQRSLIESSKAAWNELARPGTAKNAKPANSNPDQQQQSSQCFPSLVLKRGSCWMCRSATTTMDDPQSADNDSFRTCELVLLTQGLVILDCAAVAANDSTPTLLSAIPWSKVEFVGPLSSCSENIQSSTRLLSSSVSLWTMDISTPDLLEGQSLFDSTRDGETIDGVASTPCGKSCSLVFVCRDSSRRNAWLSAMETILVKYHEYNLTRHDLGWQYHCVYKPFFTLAVTNRINDDATDITNGNNDKNAQFSGLDANDINAIDDYNGLSPLHYAVRLNHGPAVESLLRAGADANLRDGENHSPVYWSVREDVSLTIFDLLAQYGATDKRSAYVNEFSKGELFGRVAATEQIMQEKQDAAVALQKKRIDAQVAATAIRDNLKLMQHRGEQIDELGSKATALNEGAQDFASMAKQLKEASKKKSQWLPF